MESTKASQGNCQPDEIEKLSKKVVKEIKSVFLPFDKNVTNPYQRQLSEHLASFNVQVEKCGSGEFFLKKALFEWKPDVVHIHWLHPFCTKASLIESVKDSFVFICELAILRVLNVKIIWTVHNLKNHNNKYLKLDRFCTKIVAKLCHAIIAHCEKAKEDIISTFNISNHDKVFAIPHGNYISCYENAISREQARKTLDIADSKTVLLFLGLIRPYKGVVALASTFNQLTLNQPANKNAELVIAGKVWRDSLEQGDLIRQQAAKNEQIQFIPEFVPDKKIQLYMNASDVVVFPYQDILTSGAVLLAMSFGKACIAPRLGCIEEILDDRGAFLYDASYTAVMQHAIKSSIQTREQLSTMGVHNYTVAQQYDWGSVAELTYQVYQSIPNPKHSRWR